jgi:hypothetical protein
VFARTEQCHQAISGRSQKLFLESQNHGIWRESESQPPFFRSLLGQEPGAADAPTQNPEAPAA